MPSIKLTKSVVDTARPATRDYEIRDTIIPGFFCKITPAGRKTFMLSYRTPTGEGPAPPPGPPGAHPRASSPRTSSPPCAAEPTRARSGRSPARLLP